jgi:hypothetical protein
MTNPAESPQAATYWAFAEASIIAKPTSCFVSTNIGDVTKSADSNSPFAATDASPLPKGATLFSLTSHGTCGQPSHWTDAEIKRLAVVVVTCGEKNWDQIAKMMPGRSKASCRRKWVLSPDRWTLNEDISLSEAVEASGEGNWDEIAARLPGNTVMECRNRWAILIADSRNNWSAKQPWTDEQENKLVHAVFTCGIGEWAVVGALVPGRPGLACRGKWERMMGKWAPEEDLELVEATKACGEGNWKEIGSKIPKRTHRQCRFRYMTIMRDESWRPTFQVVGTDETETTLTQLAKTCDARDSDEVAETCSGQPLTARKEKNRIQVATTCDSVVETVPGRTEVACSGQSRPWTDAEIKRLVDAVKTYGEWGKWAAIAAMVPNHSDEECRLKWTSAAPAWTPHEDLLLAVAVKACDEGVWLQIAARVPGRTRMACLNRWTLLIEATLAESASRTSQTSTDQASQMSGGISSPTVVSSSSDLERRIKRQRLYPSVAAMPNQPKGLPVNMTAARSPPFPSVNNGTRFPYQLPPRTVPVPIFQYFPSNLGFPANAVYKTS